MSTESSTSDALLKKVLEELTALRQDNAQLASAVDGINGRVNMLAGIKQIKDEAKVVSSNGTASEKAKESESEKTVEAVSKQYEQPPSNVDAAPRRASVSKTSKIILTSYPGQAGVDPLPMDWGHMDPAVRGPVVVSRHPNTIRRRNGMVLFFSFCSLTSLLTRPSHRCPWRFVLHLPRPCRSQQEP